MADLISREAFKRKLYEADCVDKYGFVNCGVTRINILLEQSAVDAVEVVRCKDCYQSCWCDDVLFCTYWGKDTDENGHCHEGG